MVVLGLRSGPGSRVVSQRPDDGYVGVFNGHGSNQQSQELNIYDVGLTMKPWANFLTESRSLKSNCPTSTFPAFGEDWIASVMSFAACSAFDAFLHAKILKERI